MSELVTWPIGEWVKFSVSRNGALVYAAGGALGGGSLAGRTLAWVDRRGREEPIAAPPRAYLTLRLSPDGTRVAMDVRDQESDVWIWDLARQTLTRLTFGPASGQDVRMVRMDNTATAKPESQPLSSDCCVTRDHGGAELGGGAQTAPAGPVVP